jgi:hypothetical protein
MGICPYGEDPLFSWDVNDCRIDIGGGKELRVITNPFVSRSVSKGDVVCSIS